MNAQTGDHSSLRPVGFPPGEISSLRNVKVIEQHATEAAFLWKRRERAAHAPHYKLKHLEMIDEKLRAHLHGLRVADREGWQTVSAMLGVADAGSVFVISYLAFASGDATRMRDALQLALSKTSFDRALEAALVWLELREVRSPIEMLERSAVPDHQRLALGALAGHGVDPGDFLARALRSSDARLQLRALQLAGQFKRRDLSTAIRAHLTGSDPSLSFWAACALALAGHVESAPVALEIGLEHSILKAYAIEVSLRLGSPAWARQTVRDLARQPGRLRLAIRAAAAFGDPAVIPWLLRQAQEPDYARVAGEAISTITAADLHLLDLKDDPPVDEPETTFADDQDLPWPHVQRLSDWWQEQVERYVPGQRYLGGRPIAVASTLEVLRNGYQRQRACAAIEMAAFNEAKPLFAVTDRADRQRRRLAA